MYSDLEPNIQDQDAMLLWDRDKDFKYSDSYSWGLKHLGYLWVYHQILEHNANCVLEVGAGYNTYLDRVLHEQTSYTMVDKHDYYPYEIFQYANKKRNKCNYVEALLGDFSPKLKDRTFDAVVSVSAIEHHPIDQLDDLYNDMYRVLKSGGMIAHTIDVEYKQCPEYPIAHYSSLLNSGFEVLSPISWDWCFTGNPDEGALIQPISISYAPWRKGNMQGDQVISYPISTILCLAKKP